MNRLPPNRFTIRGFRGQPRAAYGFVLPTAIFLLVILAGLAAYMVSLSRTSHISSALDIQGVRAYQAARAGIEWGAWQVVYNPTPLCATTEIEVASPGTVALAGTLGAFTVRVACPVTLATDGADTVTIYQVTSTATAGGGVDRVERQIQAGFSK